MQSTGMLFPACAGVIPWLVPGDGTFYPFPRMRGGDPLLWVRRKQAQCFSPVYAGVTLGG